MSGSLRIDRLEVRLRGGSPADGRALANDLRSTLGPALDAELRRQPLRVARVASIHPPVVRTQHAAATGSTATDVARAVADGLAREVGR